MASSYSAVLDANILIPMPLCDTLLRAAEWPLFRPLWSQEILEETRRNLVKLHLTTADGAKRRLKAMQRHWPDALVQGYEHLIPAMTNDVRDRHVLAVAVKEHAPIIVTRNSRHFRTHDLAPYHIEAQSPDAFLHSLYDANPAAMATILRQQAAQLRHVPDSVTAIALVLAALYESGATTFAEAMHRQLVSTASSNTGDDME